MVLMQKVVRVTLSGQMLQGAEEWQTGFYMGRPDADAEVPSQAFADVVRDAWATFFVSAGAAISSSYTFQQVKLARLDNGGRYDGTDVVVSYPATAKVGQRGGSPMPPQVACVATLIGGSGKGLAGKGRMYLPGVADAVSATGHFNGVVAQSISTGLATFFNTINGSFDAPGRVINASPGKQKLAGIGARNVYVNGVRVGDVYDTQRRRRNALTEQYFNAVVNDG